MFAVVRTGGKQYRVAPDDRIVVERLAGEAGALIEFADVLMIGEPGQAPRVGTPVLETARVFAEVLEQTRGDKIIVFKKKRRKNYRRKQGHRQELTVLRVTGISPTGHEPKAKAEAGAKPKASAKEEPTPAVPAKAASEAAAEAKPAKETKTKPASRTRTADAKATAAKTKKTAAAKKEPTRKAATKKKASKDETEE